MGVLAEDKDGRHRPRALGISHANLFRSESMRTEFCLRLSVTDFHERTVDSRNTLPALAPKSVACYLSIVRRPHSHLQEFTIHTVFPQKAYIADHRLRFHMCVFVESGRFTSDMLV